jgi:hypothetical protein
MEWLSALAIFGAAESILAIGAIAYLSLKVARIDSNLKAVWSFLIRRAAAKVVEKGLGTMNSPVMLHVDVDVDTIMRPIAGRLREFGRQRRQLNDEALMLEIEKTFGEQIMREICIPNGLSDGECLILAAKVARGA